MDSAVGNITERSPAARNQPQFMAAHSVQSKTLASLVRGEAGDMKPECGLLMLLPSAHASRGITQPVFCLRTGGGGGKPETLIFELRGGFFFAVVVEGLLAGGYSGE